MKDLALINLEEVSDQEAEGYKVREAARAIVFDTENNVAMLHSTVNQYYKLPGGGIESGEDKLAALKRECQEEIGCDVEVGGELGLIIEYRRQQALRQISYCYFAKVIGEKGVPHMEPGEIAEGFEVVWLPLDEAHRLTAAATPTIYQGPYMVARDTAFLATAKTQSV